MSPSGLHVNKPAIIIIIGITVVFILWFKMSGPPTESVTPSKQLKTNTNAADAAAVKSGTSNIHQDTDEDDVNTQWSKVELSTLTVTAEKTAVSYREVKPKNSTLDVLFLHGAAFNSTTWVSAPLYTLQRLSKLGYRAVAVDLPGKGSSVPSKLDNGDHLEAVIKALNLDRPVIISPSMSGSFSLPYLFKDPENVLKRARGFVAVAPVSTEKYTADQYKALKIKTLIIYGEGDKAESKIGGKSLKNLQNLPDKIVEEIKDAGHACYMNKPDDFHKVLFTFLEKL